jgi:HSP20 family molecular chaperone IbpA
MNSDFFDFSDYFFSRPMLERNGTFILDKDGKSYVLLNALGVDEKDIVIDTTKDALNRNILNVSGKTHDDVFDKDYSMKISFILLKDVKNVKWTTKNGFVTLVLEFAEPVKPAISISKF